MDDVRRSLSLAASSLALGIIYAIYGVISLLSGHLDTPQHPLLPRGGAALSLIMLLISSLYLYSVPRLLHDDLEGLSYLLAALILSAIVGTVQMLSIGADALDSLITGETYNAWDADISAAFLLLTSLPLWLAFRQRKGVE
ncbi:MAG: hypothetical protein J7K08_07930 [Thermoplasmata archaeon]|nr:hypothetical protein [Thermoplasmata archaeon]